MIAHFQARAALRLDAFLMSEVGLSRPRVETLLNFGAVYLNGKRRRANMEVRAGDVIRVHFQPKRFAHDAEIEILYEDADLLIVDKPSGLPTHPTLDNYLENVWQILERQTGRSLFVTHRLDTGTEGLLILAKDKNAQAEINWLFETRKVKKVYRAVTETKPPLGRHVHYMDTETKPPKPVFAENISGSASAILTVLSIWKTSDGHASEIELETGRTHQIRAQLAFLGCPILGDTLYGGKKFVHERLALECFHISFTHRSQTIGISRPTSLAAPQPTKDSCDP